jgi:hypothetical protein
MKPPNLFELEEFFHDRELPETLDLNQYGKVLNIRKFIDSHIATLKNYSGNKRFMPFYNRLLEVYCRIKNER